MRERWQATLEKGRESGALDPQAYGNLVRWLDRPPPSDGLHELEELLAREDFSALNDCFHTTLPFGTAGRRGTMGVGTNRINRFTIGASAEGLARYLVKQGEEARRRGVVIGFDTRHRGREFARLTASLCRHHGLTTYLFDEPRPTPEIAFAVGRLGCRAGVVISASHNPPSDNGFKVVAEDGSQIMGEVADRIVDTVCAVEEVPPTEDRLEGCSFLSTEMDEAYLAYIASLALSGHRDVRIVFSPLHGTGTASAIPVLRRLGFSDLHLLEEQMPPDGRFPSVPKNLPNPEDDDVMAPLIEAGRKLGADLVMASDPDADRLGAAAPLSPGKGAAWSPLTGNQIAILLAAYILTERSERGTLPQDGVIMKTVVTTDFLYRLGRSFGVQVWGDFLTGFKYIGEGIRQCTREGREFLLGCEESHGYLVGTQIRDKDAAIAALLLAEYAAKLKSLGKTLFQALDDLYRQHGYVWEAVQSVVFPGMEGERRMGRIMEQMREQPPLEVVGHKVLRVADRKCGAIWDPSSHRTLAEIPGPKGDALTFHLDEEGIRKVTLRPSGTEPKMKVYVSWTAEGEPAQDPTLWEATKERVNREAEEVLSAFIAIAVAE